MARHFLQSTRPLVSVVRSNIEIFATLAAMAAAAVVPLPAPSKNDGGGRWPLIQRSCVTPISVTQPSPECTR